MRTRFIHPPKPPSGIAPTLSLLAHTGDLRPTEWLQRSMTTFGRTVSSVLPGHFEAYARVFHPFLLQRGGRGRGAATWGDIATAAHVDLNDRNVFESLEDSAPDGAHASRGSAPEAVLHPLVEHLEPSTSTPASCWFAVWEGFGASAVPSDLEPKLVLPARLYHVFAGPIAGALTSFSAVPSLHQSANLWWPADRAWCVATEIDFHWPYVGGTRACIASLLADSQIEAIETTAATGW